MYKCCREKQHPVGTGVLTLEGRKEASGGSGRTAHTASFELHVSETGDVATAVWQCEVLQMYRMPG